MEVCSQSLNDPKTVLLKVNGNKCNMNCKYCSELPKNFSKEQCNFDYEKINTILEQLPRSVDIILHGGEPTLIGLNNIEKIINRIHELKFKLIPSIQTNGYLEKEWVEYFKNYSDRVKVSISIDGDKISNAYRRTGDSNSEKAFNKVYSFLKELDKNNVSFRCIATINNLSWNRGSELINFFNQFNSLKFVRMNPCFDVDKYGIKEWAISPSQYLECLKQAFNQMMITESYKKYKLDPLMEMIDDIYKGASIYEFKCNKYASIFPDGSITSCDAMREIKQEVNINTNLFENFMQPEYTREIIAKCNKCENLSICKGGCPPLMNRFSFVSEKLVDEYCNYRVVIRKYIRNFIGEQK